MKKTIQTIVLAVLCLTFGTYAQDKSVNPLALKTGDELPLELLNYPLQLINKTGEKREMRLTDAKDKLIILDFWASWCTPCLVSLKKLEGLQKQFKEELVIIPSTYEGADTGSRSLLKNGITMYSVFGKSDEFMKQYFPHRFVPHQVWIKDGKVKAVTAHYDTNDTTIRAAIYGKEIRIKTKEDITNFNWSTPLTDYAKQKGVNVNTRILVSPYIDGLGSNSGNSTEDSIHTVYYYNHPVISMYSEALDMDFNRIIPAMKNPEQFTDIRNAPQKLMFNFQLLMPQRSEQNMTNKVLKALDWSFQLKGQPVRRKAECYVIKKANMKTEGAGIKSGDVQVMKMSYFLKLLNMSYVWSPNTPIFLNESGFNGEITFTQPLDKLKKNIPELKKFLSAVGLVLEKEQRELEMFELTDAE